MKWCANISYFRAHKYRPTEFLMSDKYESNTFKLYLCLPVEIIEVNSFQCTVFEFILDFAFSWNVLKITLASWEMVCNRVDYAWVRKKIRCYSEKSIRKHTHHRCAYYSIHVVSVSHCAYVNWNTELLFFRWCLILRKLCGTEHQVCLANHIELNQHVLLLTIIAVFA